jgi:hypothetical protein
MSSANFTIKIGSAAAVPFDTLGITGANLSLTFGARDSLTIETAEDIDTADIIPPFSRCELRDPDGVLRFVGWLDQAPRRASAASERKTYTLTGPIRWLERVPYLDAEVIGEFGYPVMGWADNEDKRESIGDQVARVRTFANANGANLAAFPAGTAANLMTPYERFMNVSCLAALSTVARWTPAIALVSDGTDALTWRDSLTSTTHPVTGLLPDATDLQLNPHYDLLRSTITLRWMQKIDGLPAILTDSVTGGEAQTLGASRTEALTIEISPEEQYPATGLAAEYHRWASKLQLTCNLSADGLHWSILPAHRITFGGILSPWSDYDAVVQVIERDLFSESIRITTGPRRHLGLDQLAELARRSSLTTSSNNGPQEEEEDLPGTIETIIMGLPTGSTSKWQIGPFGGEGSAGVASAPAGSYTAVFFPVWDATGGRLYFADPDGPKTLAAEGTISFTANYEAISRLKLQSSGESPSTDIIDINVDDIPADLGTIKLREMEICGGDKIMVLCSEPYA